MKYINTPQLLKRYITIRITCVITKLATCYKCFALQRLVRRSYLSIVLFCTLFSLNGTFALHSKKHFVV